MTIEQILAIATLILFLIAQTAIMAHYFGKLSGKVTELDTRQGNSDAHFKEMEEKIDEQCEQSFKHFVTKPECTLINEGWEKRVEAILENRDLRDQQNLKDHDILIKRADADGETLIEISKCLHRLDKRFPE
jgi:hypothetical protein